uniref:WAT1-related protein At5g64700-like n=1 Tax=Erigeron canadensis TaxID=72917 RepID=UPI001CB8BBD5|nr:WAT1-related protein At5g64700-like [Erigeron canadensis]
MNNNNSLPYFAMVLVQILYAGATITMKIGFANGLNQLVFVVYRHLISTILFCPFALVFERTKSRPKLTFVVMMKIFVLSTLGSTIHLNGVSYGLAYTSATVSSALNCLTPCLTFLIAFLLRMEKVNIRSFKGQAKVVGTILGIAGTLTITFWRGGFQLKGLVDKPLIDLSNTKVFHGHVKPNWVKGATLISASKVSWSLWLILQGLVHKVYPAPLSMNIMICLFASLQSSILAVFFAREADMWKIKWDVKLLTIIYGGIVISGLTYYLVLWTINKRGPVFAAMFTPLELPIVGVFSAIAFNERLHIGSFIGALLIIVGLYSVLWGKTDDNVVKVQSKDDVENRIKASDTFNNDGKERN